MEEKADDGENKWPLAWEGFGQILRALGHDERILEILQDAFSSPEQLTYFSRMIYQYGKNRPLRVSVLDILVQYADASPFSIGQWTEALIFFHQWLRTQNRRQDLVHMLGYLQCCANSPEGKGIRQNLTSLLTTMLDFYSYKGC